MITLVRKNGSIFWIAVLVATTAWWMPSTGIKLIASIASLCVVAVGALMAFRPEGAAADPARKYAVPFAAVAIATAGLLSAL